MAKPTFGSADHVLQHLPSQRQVRHQLPQPPVVVLELLQPLDLRQQQASVLFSQLDCDALLILALRQISDTGTPFALYFKMKAFRASENADAFMIYHSFPARRISAGSSIVL